jgi:hypothetical protein
MTTRAAAIPAAVMTQAVVAMTTRAAAIPAAVMTQAVVAMTTRAAEMMIKSYSDLH